MPEKDDVQVEQEEKKELTVEDLEPVAGGDLEEEFGTKIEETAGGDKGLET